MNRTENASRPGFTPRRGQYPVFIHVDTMASGRSPAETDTLRVTPPTVHRMVLALEHAGTMSRQPGVARRIAVPELNSQPKSP
jgi:hypothetical protein